MAYTDKKYYDRQCLIVVNDDRGLRNDEIDVFTRLSLPKDVTFSVGKPSLNTIYIAHPARKGLYIPLSDHSLAIFRDKMDELVLLLQALGATDIEIVRTQGMNIEQMNRSNSSVEVEGGWTPKYSASMGYRNAESNSSSNSSDHGYRLRIKSDNSSYPFVPEGLQWYCLTPEWEKMVKQRMLGLQEYELEVRSSYSNSISSSSMDALKVTAKVLFAKLKFSYSSEYESNFKEVGEISWRLKIKFRPLKEYPANHPKTNDVSETQSKQAVNGRLAYKESCRQLIAGNGKVSDTIRIELNRLRDKFGISSDEASLIEAEFLPKKKWFWPF